MSLHTRTRSDTRNSLSDQLATLSGGRLFFLSSYFFVHRQVDERAGELAMRLRRAGDGAASPPRGAAATSVAHGNKGSRRGFRRYPTALACTAASSCSSRTSPCLRSCPLRS